jgi:hypothetical protein
MLTISQLRDTIVGELSTAEEPKVKAVPERALRAEEVVRREMQTHINFVVNEKGLFRAWIDEGNKGGYDAFLQDQPVTHAFTEALCASLATEVGTEHLLTRMRVIEVYNNSQESGQEGVLTLRRDVPTPSLKELLRGTMPRSED